MEVEKDEKSEAERLRKRANRKNKIARRLLKKINRELSKPKSDLKRVLRWQTKSARLLNKGVELMTKSNDLKLQSKSRKPHKIHFKLEKISEKFVKKFGATSCVYRATMEKPEKVDHVKVKDVTDELNSLFADAIEQVLPFKEI